MSKKSRLGRGLSSLMAVPVTVEPQNQQREAPSGPSEAAAAESQVMPNGDGPLAYVTLSAIRPNPYQPRRSFDEASLERLAASIRQDGVMQPVIVRRAPDDGATYELVAGERRWRAAERAGLERIPALVRDLDDRQLAEWAVIENLQREDLDPMERAAAFARLGDQFGLRHDQIADRVGVERSTVTNLIRLLDLHPEIHDFLRCGQLSAGHGRALLMLEDQAAQLQVARKAVARAWSVRETEAATRGLTDGAATERKERASGRSAHLVDLQTQISTQLGTKVALKPGRRKNSGTLQIEYYDLDQFEALLERMGVTIE